MPGQNSHILIAQCFQESRFDPFAISPVGAKGLCQFMPGTWSDMQKQLGITSTPFNAAENIRAAAYYDSKLFNRWTAKRSYQDRLNFMFASYNFGAKNVDRAQAKCNGANEFALIIQCLPHETRQYIKRINQYRQQLRY
jgi:soluble lytic murein transglycosylase-like protein